MRVNSDLVCNGVTQSGEVPQFSFGTCHLRIAHPPPECMDVNAGIAFSGHLYWLFAVLGALTCWRARQSVSTVIRCQVSISDLAPLVSQVLSGHALSVRDYSARGR